MKIVIDSLNTVQFYSSNDDCESNIQKKYNKVHATNYNIIYMMQSLWLPNGRIDGHAEPYFLNNE